jgi:tetratricopeptide (TPR) repeat protein
MRSWARLRKLRRRKQGRGRLPEGAELKPQQPIAANNLAYRMLVSGQNVDVALSLAQTARRGMPDSPSTADTLAWAYYNKGTYGFARDLLEEALKTDPNNPTTQYHLGMVYSKLNDKNNASHAPEEILVTGAQFAHRRRMRARLCKRWDRLRNGARFLLVACIDVVHLKHCMSNKSKLHLLGPGLKRLVKHQDNRKECRLVRAGKCHWLRYSVYVHCDRTHAGAPRRWGISST